ncbi:Putative amidoligase enzyme [Paenibacillus sp. 1_12]|uniref:amidoligase family protein n=1 Tax=Paenibacillus sp. 1_12 TaxID=1566278 RepID=UPI0008E50EC1|nr:amidoligase family protein [Paenibacillus sp. 1_12]SFL23457.1 Putative amidoligase enzyme [Paenibacillus sp. 1_12]
MWPKSIDWKDLKFGIEIEFIGGNPASLELLPGWVMSLDERQIDETGAESGSELKPPPILWEDREQIRVMLNRLKAQGATANWSCGLHVHIGLESWGQDIVLPLLDAALRYQATIQELLNTSEHRLLFCPPVTPEMRDSFMINPSSKAVRHRGRPQSHRCGINTAAWFDFGTVEIRYANGTMSYDELLHTVELCLKFVAAIGAGRQLSDAPCSMAVELEAPVKGYPVSITPPRWFQERTWLEESIIPVLTVLAAELVQDGEIHHVLPVPDGLLIAIENHDGKLFNYVVEPPTEGWKLKRQVL